MVVAAFLYACVLILLPLAATHYHSSVPGNEDTMVSHYETITVALIR